VTSSGLAFDDVIAGEVAGCGVLVDTLRYLPAEGESAPKVLYLLGFSAQTSVARAAWANLIAPRCGYLHIEDDSYVLADGGKGWELRTSRVSHGVDEMVLFPPCADRWAGVEEILVVQHEGQPPAATLLRFLEYRASVPLDARWADAIWQWSVETGSALELSGFGPATWLVRLTDDALLRSLDTFLAASSLSRSPLAA
jgi:hypothetical protein